MTIFVDEHSDLQTQYIIWNTRARICKFCVIQYLFLKNLPKKRKNIKNIRIAPLLQTPLYKIASNMLIIFKKQTFSVKAHDFRKILLIFAAETNDTLLLLLTFQT